MDTLLAGAELDDVPVFEVCGSRLVGFEYVTVVPSEETVLIPLGVEISKGVSFVDGKNQSWQVRTSGKARPRVNAVIAFCTSTPTFIMFSSVEELLESRELSLCPSLGATFWRARLMINA